MECIENMSTLRPCQLNTEYGGLVLFGRAGRIGFIETMKAGHPLISGAQQVLQPMFVGYWRRKGERGFFSTEV